MRYIAKPIKAGLSIAAMLLFVACQTQQHAEQQAESVAAFSVYPDRVEQEGYEARALSATEMTSNYQSRANQFVSPRIDFKFSINGKDNEMVSGKDHHFTCLATDGSCQTPLIVFGQQFDDPQPVPANTYLEPNTEMRIRLDMRQVFDAFQKQGYYQTFSGEKIYKEDFKGVYVAGGTAPLVWDFDNLVNFPQLELKDPDGDRVYEISLRLNAPEEQKSTAGHWKLSRDISSFPRYQSDYPLVNALYNLSLEEMLLDIEADSTFRTGKEWAGVWTRDISYSIILAMAQLQPEVSRYSLMRKVNRGRIVQDTGTGGAYPVSTDRIVWAIAAWELYKVTGDRAWLQEAYGIIRNSLEDDLKNAYNEKTGLFRGESSFLDWREQTYPEWMQPVDIYESENLGTNAVFYQASSILSYMAREVGNQQEAEKYQQLAERVKAGMNAHLWMPEKGYYGQYLYGRTYKSVSPRAEALGEALSVLFDIADAEKQQEIVAKTPITPYGITSIFPQIPNIPPYHNNGIWPFVQAYWSLAAAKAGNEKALLESLNALYRPAALFLTNKENFVASSGDFAGTQINSDRQLWSVAGTLGMVYKVFFGMDHQPDKLVFRPFVPQAYAGRQQLTNVRYRNALLDIELEGWGNQISAFSLDGKAQQKAEIPANLTGNHKIKIVLSNSSTGKGEVNKQPVLFTPETPKVTLAGSSLRWQPVPDAVRYQILKNGEVLQSLETTETDVPANEYAEYQVIAVDARGLVSFASEPVALVPEHNRSIYELEAGAGKAALPYRGYTGEGFVEVSKHSNLQLLIQVTVREDGLYAVDFRYANGSGPINTQNKAAMRTLKRQNERVGTIVLPQRGTEEWSDWGYTNAVQVPLKKGVHTFTLSFEPANENMNVEVNQAMIDHLRLTRIR